MATEIIASLSLFKTMLDMAKGLKDINDATIRNGAVIELQEKILAAQEQQATLIEHVRKLEKQVADFEAWDREKERYELAELPPGVLVYAIKEEARGGEPAHYICANCFGKRHKSFLNKDEPSSGRTKLHCPSCGWEDRIGYFNAPQVQRRPPGGGWGGGRGGGTDWMGN